MYKVESGIYEGKGGHHRKERDTVIYPDKERQT
jgi:hypothetical protein